MRKGAGKRAGEENDGGGGSSSSGSKNEIHDTMIW